MRALARLRGRPRSTSSPCSSTSGSTRCARGSACPTGRCRSSSSTASRTRCQLHHRASRTRSRTRRAAAASTAWCAATSTRPRSATIGGILYCNDGDWVESLHGAGRDRDGRAAHPALEGHRRRRTVAHGWPPQPSMSEMHACASCSSLMPGRRRSTASCVTLRNTIRGSSRLGHDGRRRSRPTASARALPDLSGNPPRAASRPARRAPHRATSRPMRCTSRPKDRSAWPRAATACARDCRSRPPITRGFPNTSTRASRLPVGVTYRWLRWFHAPAPARHGGHAGHPSRDSQRAASPTRDVVARRGHRALPARPRERHSTGPRPIFLYVGRVAVEKNIEAFLALDLPGHEVVVGDGPAARGTRAARFPTAVSPACKIGEELACAFRRPTSSCFRAAPTRSGSCCSKPWRAARRSPRFRSPGRSMSSFPGARAC